MRRSASNLPFPFTHTLAPFFSTMKNMKLCHDTHPPPICPHDPTFPVALPSPLASPSNTRPPWGTHHEDDEAVPRANGQRVRLGQLHQLFIIAIKPHLQACRVQMGWPGNKRGCNRGLGGEVITSLHEGRDAWPRRLSCTLVAAQVSDAVCPLQQAICLPLHWSEQPLRCSPRAPSHR